MNKHLLVAAAIGLFTVPAIAEDVSVKVGPVGAGVTIVMAPDRDRDRDRTTVIKEREPSGRTTAIKKENGDGTRSKTVIYDRE